MFGESEEREFKINARGLSAPGPRLMVETAMSKGKYRLMRIVVSEREAVEDLKRFLSDKKCEVKTDQVGEEFHVLVEFEGK
jgi:TusA-related sulfurtransferase